MTDDLNQRLRAAILSRGTDDELRKRVEIANRFGEDTYPEGQVIRFVKALPVPRSVVVADGTMRDYTFAAIKVGPRWFLTQQKLGTQSPMTWPELVLFLVSGDQPTLSFEVLEPSRSVGTAPSPS